MSTITLGVDVACRAAHQASCADATGQLLWSGRRFRTTPADLEQLWALLGEDAEVTVVMEPTRNAWVPLAAWFQAHGAKVVLVPPEQSADLRDYYNKHTKTDRLDSRVLARLPLLHPEGLEPVDDLGPACPLKRAVRRRSSLVKRRTATFVRIDALLELAGPVWADVLGLGEYGKAALAVLERTGADPRELRRLGKSRLTALLIRHSHGAWRETKADELLTAAEETIRLWTGAGGALDFAELAEDIAAEARLASQLCEQTAHADERIAALYGQADPAGIVVSAPGLGSFWPLGSWAVWATLTGSPTCLGCARSLVWFPLSTSPVPPAGTAGLPKPATRACARRCFWPLTPPARSILPWPPATTGSSCASTNIMSLRCVM
jgi:hypothetical protein